jgi:hypothetical protein
VEIIFVRYSNYDLNKLFLERIILKTFLKMFAWAGSFSQVQLTILPFERQTSADTIMVIREELAPKTPENQGCDYGAACKLSTVNLRNPERPVFQWSVFGHNLCPVFKR